MESAARALLGAEHPLVRVMDDLHARLEQAMALMGIIAAGAAAALTGVADTRAALAAATVVEIVLVCALGVLAVAKRDRILDLIIEGRESLALPPIAHERERLLDPHHRAQLAHSLEALRDEAEHPVLRPPSGRPLYRRRVIAAVARDLLETARSLRCEHAGSAGVAITERLLSRHDSPLYGENAEPATRRATAVPVSACPRSCHRRPRPHGACAGLTRWIQVVCQAYTGARPRYTRWIQARPFSA